MTTLNRTTYIGGSDAAAVLGLSPWPSQTPLACYLRKIGEELPGGMEPDRAQQRNMERGKLMEPVALRMLEMEHPVKITKRSSDGTPNRYQDKEVEFLAAEIDAEWEVTEEAITSLGKENVIVPRELIGTTQNIEVKSHHFGAFAKMYGEVGTDEIPAEYGAQAMHGLSVTGRQLTLFVVMVGYDPILYAIRRDDDTIRGMRDRMVRFWLDNVQARVPPAPIIIEDVYRILKRDVAKRREATGRELALVQSLRVLKERAQMTEDAITMVQFELGCYLLGADVMEKPKKEDIGKHVLTAGGQPVMWVASQQQERIDSEMLHDLHPEVAKECAKISRFFTFNLKRSKP